MEYKYLYTIKKDEKLIKIVIEYGNRRTEK